MGYIGNAKRESKALNDAISYKCVIKSSPNAWMNEGLTVVWVQNVLETLAWDSFDCHLTDDVTDNAIIPDDCTKFIQPSDISWNKPFKLYVTEKYDEWMTNGVHECTGSGIMKATPRKLTVKWILERA